VIIAIRANCVASALVDGFLAVAFVAARAAQSLPVIQGLCDAAPIAVDGLAWEMRDCALFRAADIDTRPPLAARPRPSAAIPLFRDRRDLRAAVGQAPLTIARVACAK